MLVRVARWDALGSALKEDVHVRLAVSTMALPGDTPYAAKSLRPVVAATLASKSSRGSPRRAMKAGPA